MRRKSMLRIFHKSRKHPIIRDEYGRSARQQAFELYKKGYRPSQIFKEKLIPVPMKTLLRYFEEWKKRTGHVPKSILKEYLKEKSEFSPRSIKLLAKYFGVSEGQIIRRMQKPWGVWSLSKGELPDNRLYRIRSEMEFRLEAALRLIYLANTNCWNSPEQMNQFLAEILTLENNSQLVISKIEGQIAMRKERLQEPS
jgi:hypothetical protein